VISCFVSLLLLSVFSLCSVAFALPQTGAKANDSQINQFMSITPILGEDNTSLTEFSYKKNGSLAADSGTIKDNNGTLMYGALFDISYRSTPKEENFLGFETGYIISTEDSHSGEIEEPVGPKTISVNYKFSYTQIPVLMTYTDMSINHKFSIVAKIGPSIVNFESRLSGPSEYSLITKSNSAMLLTLGLDAHFHVRPNLDIMIGFMASPTALLLNGATDTNGIALNGIWSIYGGVSYYI
jgi:hypothetical protein